MASEKSLSRRVAEAQGWRVERRGESAYTNMPLKYQWRIYNPIANHTVDVVLAANVDGWDWIFDEGLCPDYEHDLTSSLRLWNTVLPAVATLSLTLVDNCLWNVRVRAPGLDLVNKPVTWDNLPAVIANAWLHRGNY